MVAIKIVVIYALVSGLWIYTSDRVLGMLVRDPATLTRYSVFKGFLFIVVTVIILYKLITRYIKKSKQAEEALQKAHDELEHRVAERTAELEAEAAKRIRMVEELREKDKLLIQQNRLAGMGEMLGNIAHQWRQPLNHLGLKVQHLGLLYESGELNNVILAENIDKIMDIVLHLSNTIDDFRNLSMPDREKSLFSVNQVLATTVSLIQDTFNDLKINLGINSSGDVLSNGYPNEYAQVLLNILMNARDAFQEQHTKEPRVAIRSFAENGKAVVTICDNAGGIKVELMDKIFDAYFTTKTLGKGTGIGLFMSKTIIEKNMGGRLTVANVNGGAEFRVEI